MKWERWEGNVKYKVEAGGGEVVEGDLDLLLRFWGFPFDFLVKCRFSCQLKLESD